MKNQVLAYMLAGIAVLGLASCTPQSTTIEGKVSNISGNTIIYWPTADGVYNSTRRDTLFVQADSTYHITLPGSGNEKISFYVYGQRYLGTIYVGPGTNKLDIDASLENSLNIENKLVKENEIVKELSQVQEDVFNLRARKGDVFDVEKDTVASSVYQKLTDYGASIEQKIVGVDELFKKRAVQDIRMQMLLAFMNQYFGINYRGSEEAKKEWETVYPKMLAYTDINQLENVFSEAFADVIGSAAGIELYMKTGQQPTSRNESNQKLFDWYKANLKGRVQEVAMSNIILEDASNETFSTDIPSLYGQFKELYPSSKLIPALDEAVQKNISFNKLDLPEGIHILNTDSVRSFKEITDRYLGKVIFIDIWATWCGPCRASFAHVKPLQQYAKENDIVLLYVSIDRPMNADLWKKMAGYYDLKGDHVIINEYFKMDVYNTYGNNGMLSIPHCAIINKKGELQFKGAASPENMDKLAEQLQEAAQ